MTEEQKQNYLKAPYRCPYCNSENIDELEPADRSDPFILYQKIGCHDCEKEWTDEYKLVNVTE